MALEPSMENVFWCADCKAMVTHKKIPTKSIFGWNEWSCMKCGQAIDLNSYTVCPICKRDAENDIENAMGPQLEIAHAEGCHVGWAAYDIGEYEEAGCDGLPWYASYADRILGEHFKRCFNRPISCGCPKVTIHRVPWITILRSGIDYSGEDYGNVSIRCPVCGTIYVVEE